MGVSIEWVIGVVRAGRNFSSFGDPYDFSCTVILRGETAELIGASGRFDMRFRQPLIELLKERGVKRVSWERSGREPVFFTL